MVGEVGGERHLLGPEDLCVEEQLDLIRLLECRGNVGGTQVGALEDLDQACARVLAAVAEGAWPDLLLARWQGLGLLQFARERLDLVGELLDLGVERALDL